MTRWLALSLLLLAGANGCGSGAKKEKSLHDRLGGTYAIAAVCDDFLKRLLVNPTIGANKVVAANVKPERVPGLFFHLTAQVVELTGGPYRYHGRTPREGHDGMNITGKEWDAMVEDFLATLEMFKVPQRERDELVALVASTRKDIARTSNTKWTTRKEEGTSLYHRLGGTYAISAVSADVLQRLLKNDTIMSNPDVAKRVDPKRAPGLLFHFTALVVEATGGPGKYTGKDMKSSHAQMNISGKEWDALVEEFLKTLDKFKVPAKERKELVDIVASTKKDIVTKP